MLSLKAMRRLCAAAILTAATVTTLNGTAHAELIYGITDAFSLVSFDSATPGTINTVGAISGLASGHTLRGIDFRASNGQLYALSTSGTTAAQLYTVNLASGALTTVGSGLTLTGNGSTFISIDFNPVADAIRVVSGSGQSYRINANTGALAAQDTSITPAANSFLSGVAYTNNVAGATSTTLYAYDFSNNILGNIGSIGGTPNSPNGGVFTPIGNTGIVASSANALGFDISGVSGIGYINATNVTGTSSLYTVNLGTGALTSVGSLGAGILDISVRASVVPEPGTFALIIPAALGALVLRRRRKA